MPGGPMAPPGVWSWFPGLISVAASALLSKTYAFWKCQCGAEGRWRPMRPHLNEPRENTCFLSAPMHLHSQHNRGPLMCFWGYSRVGGRQKQWQTGRNRCPVFQVATPFFTLARKTQFYPNLEVCGIWCWLHLLLKWFFFFNSKWSFAKVRLDKRSASQLSPLINGLIMCTESE